jgi:PPOX class probable F420-dependent enzyme
MEIEEKVRKFLEQRLFGVLATTKRDGSPQQSVIWYVLDGDEILMNTRAGRAKDANMRRAGRASLCVADDYSYVTVEGAVAFNDDQAVAQADIRRLAIRYDGEESGNQQAEEKFSKQQRVTVRMKIENVIVYQVQ